MASPLLTTQLLNCASSIAFRESAICFLHATSVRIQFNTYRESALVVEWVALKLIAAAPTHSNHGGLFHPLL